MSREYDKHIDALIEKITTFGYNKNDLYCIDYRLKQLREREAALLALCPFQPGAVAVLARDLGPKETAGFDDWRSKAGEPVEVLGIGYKDGRHTVAVVYVHDRHREYGTGHWRKTRERNRYCYSLFADVLVFPTEPPVVPWAGCACIDGDGKEGRPYGWFQRADAPCSLHPGTPTKESPR